MKTKLFIQSSVKPAQRIAWFALTATILANTPISFGASPSELLEKGIYAEETKGDLDSAIKIYEQIVAESKTSRAFAAQAQYRLGQCHHKKQNYLAAMAAFGKLISDFPDQKELVAKARQYLPGEQALESVPWVDGEVLEMVIKFPSGVKLGAALYTADLVEADGTKAWRVGTHQFAGVQAVSHVLVEADTFRPISSRWKHSLIGDVDAVYRPGQVELKFRGKDDVKKVDVEGTVYDNEEVIQMMRRLPLAIGYKTTIPVITSLGGGALIPVEAHVTAKETVEVEAGKFECFKVELNIRQTFWYSTDAHRRLVKFEAGGVIVELVKAWKRNPGEPTQFQDDKQGISLTAPVGWFALKKEPDDGDPLLVVHLLEPEATAISAVQVVSVRDTKPEEKQSARAWAEVKLKGDTQRFKDFKIRPDSWQERVVAGKPAISYVADFVEGQTPKIFYAVYVLAEPNATKLLAQLPADEFAKYRQQLDGVLDSYRMK